MQTAYPYQQVQKLISFIILSLCDANPAPLPLSTEVNIIHNYIRMWCKPRTLTIKYIS
jgi:hypothetical protein